MNVGTNARNRMSSTKNATIRPIMSLVPCSIGGTSASPVNSVWTPSGVISSATPSSRATTSARSISKPTSENWTSPYAIRPFSDSVAGASGSSAETTFGVCLASSTACARAALRSGVSRRSPTGAAYTMVSASPLRAGNFDSSNSVARAVSESGRSNSSISLPGKAPLATASPTMIATQVRIVRHGWAAKCPPRRARRPV